TEGTYDPLGRATAVWLPDRNRAAGQSPTATFTYAVSNTGITAVSAAALDPNGHYQTSYQLYDSLLRVRQTQGPSATGSGRVLADTFYDTAGRVVATNAPYYNTDSGPGTTLFTPLDNQVPGQ